LKPESLKSGPGDDPAEDPKVYTIFLSSPNDVGPERDAVDHVVDRINAELGNDTRFELIRWEQDFYTANDTFQAQITKPSDCDIVLCVFWKRLV
jgi:hypothetical protein